MVETLAERVPGCRRPMYFYSAPTWAQAKRIAWQPFIDLIPKSWLLPGSDGINRSDMVLRTKFGSELHIIGMDKPERIEGSQYCGGITDESSDMKPGAFHKSILPALSIHRGFCWRIGVPKRQGPSAGEFREFCELNRSGDDEDSISFTWPSDQIVDAKTLAQAKRIMDIRDYNEQFRAQWQKSGGGIFYAFDEEQNCKRCNYDPNRVIVVGMDFNVDPMAWVLGHLYRDKDGEERWEWFDEIFRKDTNTPEVLKILFNKYKNHKGGFMFCGDASAKARHTSATDSDYMLIWDHPGFKKLGRKVEFPESAPAIEDRFAVCNAMFENAAGQRRCFVDKVNCPNLFTDLRTRFFKPGTRVVGDSGEQGHMTDAFGYPVFQFTPVDARLSTEAGGQIYIGAAA